MTITGLHSVLDNLQNSLNLSNHTTLPKVIVISLMRAQSRRAKFIPILEQSRLQWEILDAVDGLNLKSTPLEYHEDKVVRLLGFPLSVSEIGCFLSHRLAWARCIEKNEVVLILEDDFSFSPDFESAINALLYSFQDWGVARLQGLVDVPARVIEKKDQFQIVQNLGDPLGATAYMIKPDAASRLLKCSHYIYEPLDHFLEHYQKHQIRTVAIRPYPIIANSATSTILDRPDRKSIHGFRKLLRSFYRKLDRLTNPNPWFPK